MEDASAHGRDHDGDSHDVTRDPVCGMTVNPKTTPFHGEHQGQARHFCSAGCLTKFERDPSAYLAGKKPRIEAPADAIFTCPMHPEIRQVGPGTCPICGMALEPEDPSLFPASRPHDLACPSRSGDVSGHGRQAQICDRWCLCGCGHLHAARPDQSDQPRYSHHHSLRNLDSHGPAHGA